MVLFTVVVRIHHPADVPWVLTVCTVIAAYLVFVQGNDGLNALMWAAGHARCIQLLLEYVPKVM